MGLDMLHLCDLDRSDPLVHRLLHEAETGRATLLLVPLEYVLKVGPDTPLHICRDLHQVFRIHDSTKFFAKILIAALDDACLHLLEFFNVEGHALNRAVPRYLVFDRFKKFLGEPLALDQNDTFESWQYLHWLILVQSFHVLHRQIQQHVSCQVPLTHGFHYVILLQTGDHLLAFGGKRLIQLNLI